MIVFVSDKETANVQLLTQTYITPNLILAQEWVDLYQIFLSRSKNSQLCACIISCRAISYENTDNIY